MYSELAAMEVEYDQHNGGDSNRILLGDKTGI